MLSGIYTPTAGSIYLWDRAGVQHEVDRLKPAALISGAQG